MSNTWDAQSVSIFAVVMGLFVCLFVLNNKPSYQLVCIQAKKWPLVCRSSAELTDVFEEEGCEDEAWSPPPSELRCKIAAQLEYYLSDENLEADAFLLKHVQRNKMGYVS